MKKFLAAMIVAFVVALSADCSARFGLTNLDQIVGNWYDSKGNLVLTVSSDHKFNGCEILSFQNFAIRNQGDVHRYTFKIAERNGTREIRVEYWYVPATPIDYHENLILNCDKSDAICLRRTKEPRYFESVGGIYLGMDKDQVVSRYGQPSSVNDSFQQSTWKYNREGFEVFFVYNVVTSITIYPRGNRRFDWSGLSAKSAGIEFALKYKSSSSFYAALKTGFIDIGYGEELRFYDDGSGRVSLGYII